MNIAVFHDVFSRTGTELVCMNVLEKLQKSHEITLFTLYEPDFDSLNQFCGTNVQNTRVIELRDFTGILAFLSRILENSLNVNNDDIAKLSNALATRRLRSYEGDFDLFLSTTNEIGFSNSIEYIHFPRFNSEFLPHHISQQSSQLINKLYTKIAGVSRRAVKDTTLITNSEWTAGVVESIYHTRPRVIYPPVNVNDFNPRPWSDREMGFVSVGRITPDKQILDIIEIINWIQKDYPDIHLHIVGPTVSWADDYAGRVRQAAKSSEHIFYEGEITRPNLIDLIETHRFGIHGKEYEHFGISIAEMVVGGMIPFVPDSGGQIEIVKEKGELTYGSQQEAVRNVKKMLEDNELLHDTRRQLQAGSNRFSRMRFQNKMKDVIEEAV